MSNLDHLMPRCIYSGPFVRQGREAVPPAAHGQGPREWFQADRSAAAIANQSRAAMPSAARKALGVRDGRPFAWRLWKFSSTPCAKCFSCRTSSSARFSRSPSIPAEEPGVHEA